MNEDTPIGTGYGRCAPRWLLAVRLVMLAAVPSGLVGLSIGGTAGGVILIVSGVGMLLASAVIVMDVGGVGQAVGQIYLRAVQRVSRSRPSTASRRLLIARITGASIAAASIAYCVAGVAIVAGKLGTS